MGNFTVMLHSIIPELFQKKALQTGVIQSIVEK